MSEQRCGEISNKLVREHSFWNLPIQHAKQSDQPSIRSHSLANFLSWYQSLKVNKSNILFHWICHHQLNCHFLHVYCQLSSFLNSQWRIPIRRMIEFTCNTIICSQWQIVYPSITMLFFQHMALQCHPWLCSFIHFDNKNTSYIAALNPYTSYPIIQHFKAFINSTHLKVHSCNCIYTKYLFWKLPY